MIISIFKTLCFEKKFDKLKKERKNGQSFFKELHFGDNR